MRDPEAMIRFTDLTAAAAADSSVIDLALLSNLDRLEPPLLDR